MCKALELRVRTSSIGPELALIIKDRNVAREKQVEDEIKRATQDRQAAIERVQLEAADPLPEDPEIVSTFAEKKDQFTVLDLPYLRAQSIDLSDHLKILKPLAIAAKDARKGCILSRGELVGLPEKSHLRHQLYIELKALILTLDLQNQSDTDTLRSCLNTQCPKKSRKNSPWIRCPDCKRGYCPACVVLPDFFLSTHPCSFAEEDFEEESETEAGDPSGFDAFLASLGLDSHLDESDEDVSRELVDYAVDVIAETDGSFNAEDMCSNASSVPQNPPNPEGWCPGCTLTRELFHCSQGHPRCLSCMSKCTSCSRRIPIPKRLDFF